MTGADDLGENQMSLMKGLAKVAIGLALAKGASSMMNRSGRGQAQMGGGTGFGGSMSQSMGSGGGITDMLGKMLSGDGPRGRGSMGGALEEMGRFSTGRHPGNGGAQASSQRFDAPANGSFGDMLNHSLDSYGEPPVAPNAAQEELAGVLLRALIQAAKADGYIDAGEKAVLNEHLGDLDESDLEFVKTELAKPVDVDGLVRSVPAGSEGQVYMMSVMAIELDTKEEAKYLQQLAQALGLSPEMANQIHDRMGEPRIFS